MFTNMERQLQYTVKGKTQAPEQHILYDVIFSKTVYNLIDMEKCQKENSPKCLK